MYVFLCIMCKWLYQLVQHPLTHSINKCVHASQHWNVNHVNTCTKSHTMPTPRVTTTTTTKAPLKNLGRNQQEQAIWLDFCTHIYTYIHMYICVCVFVCLQFTRNTLNTTTDRQTKSNNMAHQWEQAFKKRARKREQWLTK